MKRILLVVILISMQFAYANTNISHKDNIKTKLEIIEAETNTYAGEKISPEERLKNIEIYVFGEAKSGDINKRIEKISKTLGIPLVKEENTKITSNSKNPEQEVQKQHQKFEDKDGFAYYSPKTNIDNFNKIEKKLFGRNFDNESTPLRLSRIEKKLFNKSFDYESEQTRLDRLQAVEKAAKSNKEYKINKFAKFAISGAQIGGLVLLILAMIL